MTLKPITRQEQIVAGKDLEPITRMEKFLKKYGGGSGGGASSWNDLKDKPFYTEKETIVEQQILEFSSGSEYNYSGVNTLTSFVDGEQVIVYMDGELHNLTVNGERIGDLYTIGFQINIVDDNYAGIDHVSGALSHEVGITRETVHKLDAKYLPYDFLVRSTENLVETGDGGYDSEGPFYEVVVGEYDNAKQKICNDLPVIVRIVLSTIFPDSTLAYKVVFDAYCAILNSPEEGVEFIEVDTNFVSFQILPDNSIVAV